MVTAREWEGSCPSFPPPPRSDPDVSPASFSQHFASPGATGGWDAASGAPGLALGAVAAAPGERGGSAERTEAEGQREPQTRSGASSFHPRAVVQQPEEREPRAPRKTSRAHKQSHVASGPGGPG